MSAGKKYTIRDMIAAVEKARDGLALTILEEGALFQLREDLREIDDFETIEEALAGYGEPY